MENPRYVEQLLHSKCPQPLKFAKEKRLLWRNCIMQNWHIISTKWDILKWNSKKSTDCHCFWVVSLLNFKMSFWCHQIFQKTKEFFFRISALASKKRSNEKKSGHFLPLIGRFYFDSLTLLFWFHLFLEAGAEIL